ncbi:hypothetical protein DFH09DRAFT_897344, partial [Mycena vulgaris]
ETRYTLAMFVPDAPSAMQPTSSQFRHWMAHNWAETDGWTHHPCVAAHGPAANPYRPPPGPPKGNRITAFVHFREAPNFFVPEGAPESSIDAVVRFGERNGLEMIGVAFDLVRGED